MVLLVLSLIDLLPLHLQLLNDFVSVSLINNSDIILHDDDGESP